MAALVERRARRVQKRPAAFDLDFGGRHPAANGVQVAQSAPARPLRPGDVGDQPIEAPGGNSEIGGRIGGQHYRKEVDRRASGLRSRLSGMKPLKVIGELAFPRIPSPSQGRSIVHSRSSLRIWNMS